MEVSKIETEIMAGILIFIMVYAAVTFDIIMNRNFDFSFLNPIKNYKEWHMLNWFGVGIMTIFSNIIFLPYAIMYWSVKFSLFLITVGRKEK